MRAARVRVHSRLQSIDSACRLVRDGIHKIAQTLPRTQSPCWDVPAWSSDVVLQLGGLPIATLHITETRQCARWDTVQCATAGASEELWWRTQHWRCRRSHVKSTTRLLKAVLCASTLPGRAVDTSQYSKKFLLSASSLPLTRVWEFSALFELLTERVGLHQEVPPRTKANVEVKTRKLVKGEVNRHLGPDTLTIYRPV